MALVIRDRQTGQTPERIAHGPVLLAERTYVIEGPPDLVSAVEDDLPGGVVERIAGGVLLVCFGNAVGLVRAGPLGRLDVRTAKLDSAAYDRLLEEVSRRASALPFAAGARTQQPFARDTIEEDILYHAFVYLRGALSSDAPGDEALMPALQTILREPHHRFNRVQRSVPSALARRVEPATLVDVAAGKWPLGPTRMGGAVARSLGGRLPQAIEESVARRTLDTSENRFVKAFLDLCVRVLVQVEAAASTRPFARAIAADCRRLHHALAPIVRHAMWSEVSRMVHMPASSTVLQGRASYRIVFRHYTRLHLGARLPMDAMDGLLEVKDVARLYEVWCCFASIDALTRVLGPPRHVGALGRDAFAMGLPRTSYGATWATGERLVYNPRFSKNGPLARRSYSVPLQPDLALWVPRGAPNAGIHVLDAKFRLEWLGEVGTDASGDLAATYKRVDLYKMHAYRDALKARSAWVLYPGTRFHLFQVDGTTRRGWTELPGAIAGVGAVPLAPDGDLAAMSALMAALVRKEAPMEHDVS